MPIKMVELTLGWVISRISVEQISVLLPMCNGEADRMQFSVFVILDYGQHRPLPPLHSWWTLLESLVDLHFALLILSFFTDRFWHMLQQVYIGSILYL